MKVIKKIMLTWSSIFLFLVFLFLAYNQMEHDEASTTGDLPGPTALHPIVEENKNKLLKLAAKKNIDVVITDGKRSFESQNELYARGRTTNGNIVTNARGGESYHNYGLAIDYALKNKGGDIIWDIHYDGNRNGESDWFEVAALAKELGFEWGGDWNNKDYPHLQLTFGYSIEQLRNGDLP